MTHFVEQPTAVEPQRRASSVRISRDPRVKIVAASAVTVVALMAAWQTGIFAADSTQPPRAVTAAPVPSVPNPPPSVRVAPAATPAGPDRGFSNPAARCDAPQQAIAAGRTQDSLVVICRQPDGRLQYKGVRLSLGTGTQIDDVRPAAGGTFVARNETAIYTVTPTQLLIAAGGRAVSSEKMLEYRTPRALPAPAAAPKPAAGPRPAAPPKPAAPPPPPPAAAPKPPPPVAAPKPPPAKPRQPPMIALPADQAGTGKASMSFLATAPWRLHYSVQCPAGVPVGGYITGGGPGGAVYYVDLRASATKPETASGSSLTKSVVGPVSVTVVPDDDSCGWTVSLG